MGVMRKKRRSTYSTYARRNWFSRNKVLIIIISALLFLALVGAGVLFFLQMQKKQQEEGIKYEAMRSASIPVLSMTYADRQVNMLHGYTQEMDFHYIRRNIFILEDTYDIPVQIALYGNKVESISYKVIDSEIDNLIQSAEVESFQSADDILSCNLKIDNLIDEGKEYILDIILATAREDEIHYYTRIKRDATTSLSAQIDLALEFHQAIYNANDDEVKAYIASKLDTKYWMDDNTDFSKVSLYSSISSVTWGKMKAEISGEPDIEILDVDGELGYLRLNYTMTRSEGDDTEHYRVSDYYRLRVTGDYAYILNYERTADQVFDPAAADTIGTRSARLGIISDKDISMMSNPSGTLSCFVADHTLWAMDTEVKTIREIFTFSVGVDDIRGNYDKHNIRIVNVSDEGDIQFIVYGYMNAGLHEGRVGIGMYTYHADTKEVSEEIFIPTNLPYEILKNSVGSLFYLSSNNDLYIMMDQYLYKLAMDSDEAELVTDGLVEGTYLIHTEGRLIAWHEGSKINDARSITVLNLETGKSYTVNADPGCCIKALGFLNQSLVYGQGVEGNTFETQTGHEYLLMNDMYVINERLVKETETSAGDGFFYTALNEYNRVVLKKVVRSGSGYDNSDDYTLFAAELEAYPSLEEFTQYEEVKKTVYYVRFADSTTTAGNLSINSDAVVLFTNEKTIDIRDMLEDTGKYYVYAKGEVVDLVDNAADAIITAYDASGVVLESDGALFYKRGLMPGEVELSSVTVELALEKIRNDEMINVTGISLIEALYYTAAKIPFAWEWDGHTYLFLGYDYSDNITMMDVASGEQITYTSAYIEDLISTEGHTYVVK